jgi:hypothetical protein
MDTDVSLAVKIATIEPEQVRGVVKRKGGTPVIFYVPEKTQAPKSSHR